VVGVVFFGSFFERVAGTFIVVFVEFFRGDDIEIAHIG
jgi:hypothetical protein